MPSQAKVVKIPYDQAFAQKIQAILDDDMSSQTYLVRIPCRPTLGRIIQSIQNDKTIEVDNMGSLTVGKYIALTKKFKATQMTPDERVLDSTRQGLADQKQYSLAAQKDLLAQGKSVSMGYSLQAQDELVEHKTDVQPANTFGVNTQQHNQNLDLSFQSRLAFATRQTHTLALMLKNENDHAAKLEKLLAALREENTRMVRRISATDTKLDASVAANEEFRKLARELHAEFSASANREAELAGHVESLSAKVRRYETILEEFGKLQRRNFELINKCSGLEDDKEELLGRVAVLEKRLNDYGKITSGGGGAEASELLGNGMNKRQRKI